MKSVKGTRSKHHIRSAPKNNICNIIREQFLIFGNVCFILPNSGHQVEQVYTQRGRIPGQVQNPWPVAAVLLRQRRDTTQLVILHFLTD